MNIFKAVSLKLASTMMLALMGAQARYLGTTFPAGEMAFFRGVFALIPIVLFFGWHGELRNSFRVTKFSDHLVRSIFSITGTFCVFGALARLPIADVTAIAFLAPLITVIFAAVFLKEQVQIYRWTAVAVGFSGVFLMLMPYLGNHGELTTAMIIGLAFALTNAFTIGGATIQIRRMTRTETSSSIVMYMTLILIVASLVSAPFGWVMPSGFELLLLIGVGITGGFGQIFFTNSLRHAPASFLAPFEYTSMLWAFLLGFWIFGEVPTIFVVLGAMIVAAAGIFVILRERYLGLKRQRETPISTLVSSEDSGIDPDAAVLEPAAKRAIANQH